MPVFGFSVGRQALNGYNECVLGSYTNLTFDAARLYNLKRLYNLASYILRAVNFHVPVNTPTTSQLISATQVKVLCFNVHPELLRGEESEIGFIKTG